MIVTFPDNLLQLMARRGWKALDLAKATGLTHVAIGNYMKGRVPRYKEAKIIADVIGISVDDLLTPQDSDNVLREEMPPIINWKARALEAERQLATLKSLLLTTSENIKLPTP